MKPAVYNEIDPFCCEILRARINDGWLPPGDVDGRDIREVKGDDYKGYGQIHLFAGIGGFGYAARLAGLPDDFGILTGGFPCQPWSVAGKQGGSSDDRHLWPEMLRLTREIHPERVLGENVPGLDGKKHMALYGVLSDLESIGYEGWPIEIPACAVDAKHFRKRLWILGYPNTERELQPEGGKCDEWGWPRDASEDVAYAECRGQQGPGESKSPSDPKKGEDRQAAGVEYGGFGNQWPPEPPVGRVVDGIPHRMDRLKSLGNAIVPQVAAAVMESMK